MRLIYIVSLWISQHLVFFVTGLLAYAVPDLPSSVQEKLARERLLEREVILFSLLRCSFI